MPSIKKKVILKLIYYVIDIYQFVQFNYKSYVIKFVVSLAFFFGSILASFSFIIIHPLHHIRCICLPTGSRILLEFSQYNKHLAML